MEDELEIDIIFIDEIQEELSDTFNTLVVESKKTDKRNIIEKQILVSRTKEQFLMYFIKIIPYLDKDLIPSINDFINMFKQFNKKQFKKFIIELSLKYEIKKQLNLNE